MIKKYIGASLFVSLMLGSSLGHAEEKKKMELLKPTGPICMFLIDEDGNDTNVPGNPPCVAAGTIVNPGDTVSPALRKKAAEAERSRKGGTKKPKRDK